MFLSGDFLCDAYASVYNATIAFQNNGGIRTDFPVGDVTYEDILSCQPFDNTVDLVTMTGDNTNSWYVWFIPIL